MAKKRKPRIRKSKASKAAKAAKSSKPSLSASEKKLKSGQRAQGIASLSEAFAFGVGALAQAEAITAKGKFEEAQLIQGAQELELASEDVIERGTTAATQTLESAKQVQGTQRAQLAASGVDISVGSASDVLAETVQFGIEDARVVKTNAFREAFGLKRQAVNVRGQAAQSRVARKFKAKTTLISGGLSTVKAASSGFGKLHESGAFE